MTKLQHFFKNISHSQAVKTSVFTVFFLALCAPLFAQTVSTVSTGVYYHNGFTQASGATPNGSLLYCNGGDASGTAWSGNTDQRSFVYSPAPASNQNQDDPWVSSGLIEYDQPYPNPAAANNYPNHCLGLCASFACSNLPVGQSTYSVAFPLQRVTFDIFKYYNGKNPKNPDELPAIRSIDVYPMRDTTDYKKYTCGSYHCSNAGKDNTNMSRVAECLGANWICDGTDQTTTAKTVVCTIYSTGASSCGDSVASCSIKSTDPTKMDCSAPGGNTTTCTIPDSGSTSCSVNVPANSNTSLCWKASTTKPSDCSASSAKEAGTTGGTCYKFKGLDGFQLCQKTAADPNTYHGCCISDGHSDCLIFDNNGEETKKALNFCTGWDGFYEIAGEFGKTNGDFGFRATAYTDVPSDGVVADRIEISETGVYPGHNGATQIPIQIDVTNVHTVRSTPSLVGTITPVSAQPYTFTYRLSKDADVRIAIYDASTADSAYYAALTGSTEICDATSATTQSACVVGAGNINNEWTTINGVDTCCKKNTKQTVNTYDSGNSASFANGGNNAAAAGVIVRTLVDWQPRTGEGMKGTDKDTQISDFDSWDGRHDQGFLLPAGNYIASIQAKSQDEWPGIDFSRAVTRQVSLDPLKLTDIQVTGLNKKSTAYATISYVPTEPATVYWEVYTPGTTFEGPNGVSEILTDSSTPTGTAPTILNNTGTLIYRSAEQKSGRMNYTARWDGTCQAFDPVDGTPYNCVRTYAAGERKSNGLAATAGETEIFAHGAPMPDGNYVYVLWAEIPYNGKYVNAIGSADKKSPAFTANATCSGTGSEINNQCFTGVKTLRYMVGTLELERGLVGITMQPATYATLGSSPTAYGLDPFIFKYALDRDAQVIATVENTAGVVVKYLTPQEGTANVAQQLNTLSWDGRDDQGRMVYPGTYMFRVKAMDAMFPAQSNEAITVFPVDMYRVVDVSTTDVYGDSGAKATISYHLSKTMNAQVNIYNKDVVIPQYNSTTGDYNHSRVTATYTKTENSVTAIQLSNGSLQITPTGGYLVTSGAEIPVNGSLVTYNDCGANKCRNTWVASTNRTIVGNRDLNADLNVQGDNSNEPATGTYTVFLRQEILDEPASYSTAAWPPQVCATDDPVYGVGQAKTIFVNGGSGYYVDPVKVNQYKAPCIYVNDKNFVHYPTLAKAASGVVDVRLQPIHTFNRSKLSTGDDSINMEEWDALYFYNPNPSIEKHTAEEIAKCTGPTSTNEKANCPYEMVPDGQYPFFIAARSNEPFNRYYYDSLRDNGKTFGSGHTYTVSGEPFRKGTEFNKVDNIDVQQEDYLYATDKVVSKINITRGPVYFLENSVAVFPNAPQLFNASTTTLTFIPPYEINFAISRAATVEVAIVALEPGMCSPVTDNVLSDKVNVYESRTNVAGDICKFLSTMTIMNTGNFDANAIRKIYWDGTDHTGNYVKPGAYEVRLTARNYPDAKLYDPTVKSITLVADLFKVYDLKETENAYAIAVRGQNMKIGYQISVPMKVAIQIFKPGTTIYDYSKGTLRNPTTGKEVKDIREVLVRAIVGIRPAATLIEEVWDGRDYAQQEVPDGIYPFRFVTSTDSAAIDSVTGEVLFGDDTSENRSLWKMAFVGDTTEYAPVNMHKATVAVGDGQFVCSDWQKTVFFYPNPFNNPAKGTLEITKMPVPGTVSIKYFNLAGDLVRDSDYTCVDANNYQTTMGKNLYFQPDNNVSSGKDADGKDVYTRVDLNAFANVRNAALRCRWDRTNQHGKKVARGVYFGLVDFKAYNGREHCQKVVKILIP